MDRLSHLLAFLEEDPNDSFIRFAIASEYVKLGREADARRFFEDLVRRDPEYIGTYFHLGKLYERLGEQGLARDVYRSGIGMAARLADGHARAELQSALLESEGIDFE